MFIFYIIGYILIAWIVAKTTLKINYTKDKDRAILFGVIWILFVPFYIFEFILDNIIDNIFYIGRKLL